MKINVAELLKDCPRGMELDCTMFDEVTLLEVTDKQFPIKIAIGANKYRYLTETGGYDIIPESKCVIFPKGKNTWEGFVPPCGFKDGDILTSERGSICIYKGPMYYNQNLADFYCGYRISDHAFVLKKFKDKHFGDINKLRRVSEIEKQYFFQILLDNGYKWNPETKILEKLSKPRFKIGDKIKLKNSPSNIISTVTKINDDGSICVNDYTWVIKYELQYEYELVPNKFDINTLKPFDRVLTRDCSGDKWNIDFFGRYRGNGTYQCMTFTKNQCIPYEGNEHLLDKTDDCNEFYKTW